ncbi:MAG: hypothetical protein U9Q67_04065 [Patescibacteria group bacterium]|nr:hypothetical protein [Patescibacteria group bacterium]
MSGDNGGPPHESQDIDSSVYTGAFRDVFHCFEKVPRDQKGRITLWYDGMPVQQILSDEEIPAQVIKELVVMMSCPDTAGRMLHLLNQMRRDKGLDDLQDVEEVMTEENIGLMVELYRRNQEIYQGRLPYRLSNVHVGELINNLHGLGLLPEGFILLNALVCLDTRVIEEVKQGMIFVRAEFLVLSSPGLESSRQVLQFGVQFPLEGSADCSKFGEADLAFIQTVKAMIEETKQRVDFIS